MKHMVLLNRLLLVIVTCVFSCNPGKEKELTLLGKYSVAFNDGTVLHGYSELNNRAILFQFERFDDIEIAKVDFFINGRSLNENYEWTCGLTKDLRIVRCSSATTIFESERAFVDNGVYTVRFVFSSEIEISGKQMVELRIDSNRGKKSATFEVKEKTDDVELKQDP